MKTTTVCTLGDQETNLTKLKNILQIFTYNENNNALTQRVLRTVVVHLSVKVQ